MSTQTPEITRAFGIDVGHRLQKHESKCRNAHGHRYQIEVSCRAEKLDAVGRVIDFGKVKEIVGDWLDASYDHGFVYEKGDPIGTWLEVNEQKRLEILVPPSIENLVKLWFLGAHALLAAHTIEVTRVKAYETPNCWAEYTIKNAYAEGALR
jgi:6-pyruvoyltetrahydropterin/6-carboxytetrahydropterin synthase